MIKNKGLLVRSSIIVTVVTFFVGIALAERVAGVYKEKGCVFIDGSVKEISVSESVVEKNRKLVGWERTKREPIEKKLRRLMEKEERLMEKQEMIQDDYIKRRQKQEEQERRQEQERIKKEDWFR